MKRVLLAAVLLAGCRQPVNWSPDAPWSRTPITVDWSEMGPVFDSSFTAAIGAWNYAAGCGVLARAAGAPAMVDVTPYDGTACGRDAHLEDARGSTAGTWRCSDTHAEVKLRVLSDIRSVFVIAEHEMGHVLGLAHDRSALMQASPALYDPAQLSGSPGLLPLPSDADGAAVGARYCR
jgi:hypothetical protein